MKITKSVGMTQLVASGVVPSRVPAPVCYPRPWSRSVAGVRLAPMHDSALEQTPARKPLPVMDNDTPSTKDVFARPGIRTKEPPV